MTEGATGDLAAMAARVIDAARARGVTLATAESCTGGLIGTVLTEIAGASDVFDRGFITYSNAAKTEMLGVLPATLRAHGAVSEVAAEMAAGARRNSAAALAVSVTGVAGPGSSGRKPEGGSASASRTRPAQAPKPWVRRHRSRKRAPGVGCPCAGDAAGGAGVRARRVAPRFRPRAWPSWSPA